MLGELKRKIRQGQGPFYGPLRKLAWAFLRGRLPFPSFFKPLLRNLYELHFAVVVLFRRALIFFYKEPLFRSRCASAGKNLHLYTDLPYVEGHAEIHLGDNVTITGSLTIISGHLLDRPVLRVKDRVVLGAGSFFSVNREVVIEEDVLIANDCRISDNDGHPRDAQMRAQQAPLRPRDIRPVRICRHAWIGNRSQIMKGVTIGEGAIIGANSVVISDIPEYCIAMGNPAEVYFRNIGRNRTSHPAGEPSTVQG